MSVQFKKYRATKSENFEQFLTKMGKKYLSFKVHNFWTVDN